MAKKKAAKKKPAKKKTTRKAARKRPSKAGRGVPPPTGTIDNNSGR